jgi:hypothetical protein
MLCDQCSNSGKVNYPGVQVCPVDLGSWGYCQCPVGQAVAEIESTIIHAEDVPAAVRKAIDLGTQFRGVGIPRYQNRDEVNAQLDALDAEIAEKGLYV